jgi:hypothetical protein
MRGPSENAAYNSATMPIVTTATLRRIQAIRPKNRMTRPQPKNEFCSDAFWLSRLAVALFPATDLCAYAVKEPRSAPKPRTNSGSP